MRDLAEPTAARLPRWRGFNLQEKFSPATNGRFREEDFATIAGWGLDFVRLPMDYRLWSDEADPYALHEPALAEIDEAVALGWTPVEGIVDLGVAQSMHAYDPWAVSHWRAPWFTGAETWPEPTWPLRTDDGVLDKAALLDRRIGMWKRLEARGVGVHVGEFGTYSETPHAVTLAWMRDWLDLLDDAGWGWAIWNLRGSYGPLDSGRADAEHEDLNGHRLDRAMLDLILRQ